MNLPTPETIQQAVKLLRAGELIGLPTETVYGLAADALNPVAVRKIFRAKGRPADHPLIVHLSDAHMLSQWASHVPAEAVALAKAFWPGPLTLILKRAAHVPPEVTGGQDTIGIRIPSHPVALALLKAFGSGVAAPSANRFGRISPTTSEHVREELGEQVALVLEGGACTVGIESTILDLSRLNPVILRPGAISAQAIAHVIGCKPVMHGRPQADSLSSIPNNTAPRVSGSLAAHYAPVTPLRLIPNRQIETELTEQLAQGRKVAIMTHDITPVNQRACLWKTVPANPAEYAQALYANLRQLDQARADMIIIETPPDLPDWHAIADRLKRAATGSGGTKEN